MGETDSDADPRTAEGMTQADQLRDAARNQFQTPTWMGERPSTANQVPAQGEPAHDAVAANRPPTSAALPDGILEEAHWTEHTRPRVLAGAVLTVAVLGAIVALVIAVVSQSIVALVALAVCAVVAILFRGALISTGVTTVDLRGATLTVHREGVRDSFNLMDPQQRLEVVGTAGSPDWRLRLEGLGGRVIELNPTQVEPHELMPSVEFYQLAAAREREERARRFNR